MYKIKWKVVVNIKKVKLIFIGAGICEKYEACVSIYNECGKLVFKGKTKKGKITLNLRKKEVYKLIAKSCGETIYGAFYVKDCKDKYVFVFQRGIINIETPEERTITFLLTDLNYNLPIEKGEIVLWQR